MVDVKPFLKSRDNVLGFKGRLVSFKVGTGHVEIGVSLVSKAISLVIVPVSASRMIGDNLPASLDTICLRTLLPTYSSLL